MVPRKAGTNEVRDASRPAFVRRHLGPSIDDRALTDGRMSELIGKYSEAVHAYQRLLQKYSNLVERHLLSTQNRGKLELLAEWFAFGPTGFALMNHGRVTLSNDVFRAIEAESQGLLWQEAVADGEGSAPTTLSNVRDILRNLGSRIHNSHQPYLEARYQRSDDNRTIEVRLQRAPLDGMYIGIISDITKRARIEAELDAKREDQLEFEHLRSLGMLTSGIAHDLNNALHSMELRLSLLEADPAHAARHSSSLRRVLDDCSAFVSRLQDSARQRHNRPLKACRIADVIAQAVAMVSSEVMGKSGIVGKNTKISTFLPDLPTVQGDEVELRHVFMNLLINARDAMPKGGEVRIEGAMDGDHVNITIADEGRGIPERSLKKVFDPFFTTKGAHGTGLGLSMAYSVMTRLGGEIRADNRRQGGAVFTLRFPVTKVPVAKSTRKEKVSKAGRSILLVDDSQDILVAFKELFELRGHRVDQACNGPEAIEKIKADNNYDLVLCDLGLEGMNGWEVAKAVREIAPALPLYLLTGWAKEISDGDPRRELVSGVVAKPLNVARLEQLLAEGVVARPRRATH
jgi:signal transduction histidine kinase/CheY-like chemotaxis protein